MTEDSLPFNHEFFNDEPRDPKEIVGELFESAQADPDRILVVHDEKSGIEWLEGINSEGNSVTLIRPDKDHKKAFKLMGVGKPSFLAAIIHVERPPENSWVMFKKNGLVEKQIATFGLLVTGETFLLEVKKKKLLYTSVEPKVFAAQIDGEFAAFVQG